MDLQSIVRWLMPKEDRWFTFLEKQAEVAHDGAMAFAQFKNPGTTVRSIREQVQAFEHAGDKLVHEMEEALAKTFVTPIDREDLQRLSSELDTILDLANASARACDLLGVERPSEPMVRLMDKLTECTALLKQTLPSMRHHRYGEVIEAMRSLRKLEKEADTIYREAISALFRDPAVDAKVLLRERDVLEGLENAIDHCEQVAHTLINLAVKHG